MQFTRTPGNPGPRWHPLAKCFPVSTARGISPSCQPEQASSADLFSQQPVAWGWGWDLAFKSDFVSFQWSLFQIQPNLKPQVVFNTMTPRKRKQNPPGGEEHCLG